MLCRMRGFRQTAVYILNFMDLSSPTDVSGLSHVHKGKHMPDFLQDWDLNLVTVKLY